jgi:hypothetical protein
MPSCSTSPSALIWTSGTGPGCNTAVNAATLGGATFAAPGAIGSGTAGTGAFTTLSASGNDALLYQTSNAQSFTSGTLATVTTWTKVSDRLNANFNATTGTFTAPATGYCQVSGHLQWASAAGVVDSVVEMSIVADGVAVANGQTWIQATGSTDLTCSVSAVVSLTAGQTIVVQGEQNSGSTRALSGAAAQTIFLLAGCHRLRVWQVAVPDHPQRAGSPDGHEDDKPVTSAVCDSVSLHRKPPFWMHWLLHSLQSPIPRRSD